jgi:GH15 family glucan-1,4-alpha-glucosidase
MSETSTAPQPTARKGGFLPIGAYAAIGDGHTAALVGSDGSIDWLCLPTFSDASVFAALPDPERGGSFELAPAVPHESDRRYVPATNVLETVHTTADGTVRVTDGMNLGSVGLLPGTELVRRIEGLAGSVPMRWSVRPRFGYGQAQAEIERHSGVPVASHDGTRLAIRSFDAGEERIEDGRVSGEATIAEGQRALLSLVAAEDSPLLFARRDALEARLDQTIESWRRWISGCTYDGAWREQVERSLLAIRLAIHEPGGAMVAAPTTSLPEKVGGERNFDYRFSWVRDTTFALDAVLRMGMREEAHRSFTWLLGATANTHPQVKPFYRLDGELPSGQDKLDLTGYRESRPVHSGNGASDQAQLGNYADVLDTAWLYTRSGATLDPETGLRLAQVADEVCEIWSIHDSGIWELGDKRAYTFSKMACWVALDRALKLDESGELRGSKVELWRGKADEIRSYVLERCWSDSTGSFARDPEHLDELDAATLLAARMNFVEGDDERLTGTIDAIRCHLGAGGPLLYRYSGMRGEEGAFAACSYWMAEALARSGRPDEAAETIEGMLAYTNDVGLMSEEIDPGSGELLGNFPQVLSHLSFLNAAALHAENSD